MNLMNLFNIKYLMQNLKKSKALIILLILLVPMFTSILLLSVEGDYAISFAELSIVNIIFMYIIPVVLSMTLFSYVYKKNSVDFIGSMPLSRKTIFVTNTIGGIGIIAILQLVTMISTLFLSRVLSGVIVFGSMVWDIFVFYTIAYIFVFTVSNLAMSFSGNKLSQLVAICLILFLIPFLIMSGDAFGDDYSYAPIEDSFTNFSSGIGEVIRVDEPYYFTAPNYIFDMIINGFKYEYSTESIVKMLVLSIVYIVTGLIIFDKKKLELAGESYENVNIHLVIKMLTLVPFMFVFCSLGSDDKVSVFLFFVAILAVYYFVFDLITNKKVKLKVSIPAFIISGIVVFAIFEGIIPKFGRNNAKVLDVADIESIYINSINTRYNSTSDFGMLIEDKNLINQIVSDSYDELHNSYYYGVPMVVAETVEITTEAEYKDIDVNYEVEESKYRGSNATITVNMKNGKTYMYSRYLDAEIYEQILNAKGTHLILKNVENSIPILEGMQLTDEERNEIIKLVNENLTNITYEDLYEMYNTESTEYDLYLYEYVEHKLVRNNFSTKGFRSLNEAMMRICNQKTVQLLNENYNYRLYETEEIINLIESKNPELFSGDNLVEYEKIKSQLIYDSISRSDMKEFIKKDIDKPFNASEKYIVIRTYYPTFYYTNDLEGIYLLVATNFNNNNEYNVKLNTDF